MALRILGYTNLPYRELVRNDAPDAGGRVSAMRRWSPTPVPASVACPQKTAATADR